MQSVRTFGTFAAFQYSDSGKHAQQSSWGKLLKRASKHGDMPEDADPLVPVAAAVGGAATAAQAGGARRPPRRRSRLGRMT